MRRKYPKRPLVGVGVLIKKDDEVLLVKRGSEPARGLWSIPGGLVELGEGVLEAGKREVEEETGLKIEVDALLDVIDNIIRDEKGGVRYHYVLIDFLGHPVGGELKVASDIMDARWVKIGQVNQYQITKTLEKLLRKLGLHPTGEGAPASVLP
jgi:ADP-ribose pyrophosphatase